MKALLEKVGGKAESPKEASESGGGSKKSAQKPEPKADAAAEEKSEAKADTAAEENSGAKADTAAEEKSEKLAQGLGQVLGGGESTKG